MRVTTNTFPTSLISQLNKLAERQNRAQNEVATGQRLVLPEDDPAGMQRVLGYQTEAKTVRQYRQNISTLKDQATLVYTSLQGLKKVSDRAGEIATMADGTKSPADLKVLAQEVTQLIYQTTQIANTKYDGDYLFAGTRTQSAPFTTTASADGWITGATYQGNASVAAAEINSGDTVAAQIPGVNTTNAGARGLLADSRTGADFVQHLIDLQNHLRDADVDQIAQSDRANLAKDEDNLIYQVASNGALQTRLETMDTIAANQGQSLEASVSKVADADITQTILRLNSTQSAYQAALQTGATMLNRSLLDYLR